MTTTIKKSIGTVCATALLATGFAHAPQTASADNDFIKGLAVGIGGALIVNEANKAKKRQQAQPKRKVVRQSQPKPSGPRPTIATFPTTRDQVRDYQTRLNSLGFNAGAPDGLYGGKTRTAVAQFQTSIGAAPTGKLTEQDASILFQQSNQIATGLAAVGTTPAMPQTGVLPVPNAAGQVATAPAPSFPAIAGAGAAAPAGNPAFPAPAAPGTGQMAVAGNPAFPAPAAPGTGQVVAAPGTTFPALGGAQQTAPAANPAFPSPGGAAPATNAPAFPQIGTGEPAGTLAAAPGAAAPSSTFPAVGAVTAGAAAATAAPTFPSVGGAAEAPQTGGDATVALAAAPQVALPEQEVERFSILGLSTGQPLEEALATLSAEGYSSCETIGSISHCVQQAGSNQDIVSIHAMPMVDGTKKVAAVSRRIEFGQPMQKTQLAPMMADRYANLLTAPGNMLGTADCMGVARLSSGSATGLADEIMTEDNPALAELIDNCAHFSRIVFGENTGDAAVDHLSIFLFDGQVFAASPERPTGAAAIKF